MPEVWVPPSVRKELREATDRYYQDIREAALRDATLDYWDRELRKIDPLLTIIKAKDGAEVPGVKPGYYHIVREGEHGGPPSVLPLVGDDGEFVEPTSRIMDLLRAGDLRNPQAMAERRRRDELAQKAREAEKQRGHEERVEEMMDRWKAINQTSVSMNPDAPWTQSANGRRGSKAA